MKKILFFFILITQFLNFNSFGQSPDWQWAKRAGGTDYDIGYGIASDAQGNTYVTGMFNSDSIIFGNILLINSGTDYDFFIAKYDSSGKELWAKSAVGTSNEQGNGITIDASGNLYVTGGFQSDSIIFGSTVLRLTNPGAENVFITKYDSSGKVLWAKSAGGNSYDYGKSITTDESGNVYVTGTFESSSITFGSTVLMNEGSPGTCTECTDFFIVKYDSSGNALWAKRAGGIGNERGWSITTYTGGNVYVTGDFQSSYIIFGNTVLTNASVPYTDIFTVKYDSTGEVIWAKSAGDNHYDWGSGISTDADGNVYETGTFQSLSITFGGTVLNNSGKKDLYIVKYDSTGNILWAKGAGGSDYEYANGITTDALANVYITGSFVSPSITFGNTVLTNKGLFIAKYDSSGNSLWAKSKSAGDPDANGGNGITSDASGNIYVTGAFTSLSIAFGSSVLTNAGDGFTGDFFIAKLDSTILTGNNEIENFNNHVLIYPNPSINLLTIDLGGNDRKVEVTITDIAGKLIYSTTATGMQTTEVSTNDFAAGVYLIRIQTEAFLKTEKLIVTK